MHFPNFRILHKYIRDESSDAKHTELLDECVKLIDHTENLQSVYDEVCGPFVATASQLIEYDALWIQAPRGISDFQRWSIVSYLAAVHETLVSGSQHYEELKRHPNVSPQVVSVLEELARKAKSLPLLECLDQLTSEWAPGEILCDLVVLHFIIRMLKASQHINDKLCERVNSHLKATSPFLVAYLAAMCMKQLSAPPADSEILQTDEQYAYMRMFDTFRYLEGAEFG